MPFSHLSSSGMQDRTKGYRTVNANTGIYNISERMLIIEPSTYCSIDFQSGIHFGRISLVSTFLEGWRYILLPWSERSRMNNGPASSGSMDGQNTDAYEEILYIWELE